MKILRAVAKFFREKAPEKDRESRRVPDVMHPLAKWVPGYPFFKTIEDFKFDKNHYFILHFLAGWQNTTAKGFVKYFLGEGYCTYFIDEKGQIWQQHDGNRCGWNAGRTKHKGKKIGRRCAGVEVANSGKLKFENGKFLTWYGEDIPGHEVRHVKVSDGYQVEGYYRKYLSPAQENAIAELMAWHIAKGLPFENLLGHDEVAWPRGRKNDPGGALSMTLEQFKDVMVAPLVEKYREENS